MSAPAHDDQHPVDSIEEVTHKIPLALPIYGAIGIFLLPSIAVPMGCLAAAHSASSAHPACARVGFDP